MVVVGLPTLGFGAFMDDHGVEANVRAGCSLWDICNATVETSTQVRQVGGVAWWGSSELSANFFRPLASVGHWIEFTYWPSAKWAMHLVNVVTYAGLVWLVAVLYRELRLTPVCAGLAALMFAIDDAHAASMGWISGRNTLLVVVLMAGSLLAHIKARQAQKVTSYLGTSLLAVGLLVGEAAVSTLAYLFAYALILDRGSVKERVRSLVPYAVVTVAWVGLYLSQTKGVRGLTIYRDLHTPLATLGQGLLDLPAWLESLLGLSLVSLSVATDPAPLRIACAVTLPVFLSLLLPTLRRSELARFFGLGMLLCIPPLFTTMPQDRLLVAAGFGAFGLIASAFEPRVQPVERATRVARRVFLVAHVAVAALLFFPGLRSSGLIQNGVPGMVEVLRPHAGQEVVLIHTPSEWLNASVLGFLYNTGQPRPKTLHTLYTGAGAPVVERIDERTLEMQVARGWGGYPLESLASAGVPGTPTAGDEVRLEGLEVHVLEANADGAPSRVRFLFADNLEGSDRVFYVWRGHELVTWTPPAIGQRVELEPIHALSALQP